MYKLKKKAYLKKIKNIRRQLRKCKKRLNIRKSQSAKDLRYRLYLIILFEEGLLTCGIVKKNRILNRKKRG